MTGFDLAAGFLLLASGLAGLLRGATRELVTLAALGLAAAGALFLLRFGAPMAQSFVHPRWLAEVTAGAVIFLLIYVVVRLTGGRLIRGVRQSGLSGLDRALGAAFGLVRGMVILGIAALFIRASTPPDRIPHWYAAARLYPAVNAAGNALRTLEPRGRALAKRVSPAVEHALSSGRPSADNDGDRPAY